MTTSELTSDLVATFDQARNFVCFFYNGNSNKGTLCNEMNWNEMTADFAFLHRSTIKCFFSMFALPIIKLLNIADYISFVLNFSKQFWNESWFKKTLNDFNWKKLTRPSKLFNQLSYFLGLIDCKITAKINLRIFQFKPIRIKREQEGLKWPSLLSSKDQI